MAVIETSSPDNRIQGTSLTALTPASSAFNLNGLYTLHFNIPLASGLLVHAGDLSRETNDASRAMKLPAGFPIEVRAAGLSRLYFPGFQQGRLPILSHLDDEIRKARYRELLDMRLGRIRNLNPEHGPIGRNQDAMVFRIDTNNGTVETSVLGKARRRDQAKEKETEADDEKSRTRV